MLTFQCRPQTLPSHRKTPRSSSSPSASTRPASSPTSSRRRSRAGLSEDIVRLISAKKNEPEWLLEWRLKAYRHWLTMKEPTWPNVHYPPIDYQVDRLLLRAEAEEGRARRASTRSTRSCSRPTRSSASRCASARCSPASRSTRSSTRVSVATTFKEQARRRSASSSARSPRRCTTTPTSCSKYLGSVVPYTDNFFATLNSAVFSDGSFCYIPKGVRCPMELSTYFRINAANTGQFERTLIVAEEGAYVSLPRGLHRADARREPAARRGRRAGRARRRRDQVLDRAELVPRRQGRQGRHLQLRHQARRLPRRALQDLLDAGRDRLGDHLEVPELHPAGRRLGRRVLLGGA